MLRVKSVHLLPVLACLIAAALPVQAQSTGVGKRGIYGKNSMNPEATSDTSTPAAKPAASAAPKQELTEEQKRLLQKYPLSTTPKTGTNQKAHDLLLQAILNYKQTRAMFAAANEITSSYSDTEFALEISQKGIVTARLQPADLLLYGPENAFISLRLRALQDCDRLIAKSIAGFSQAQSLAPSLSLIPKWLRVARDTQKAIRYHIRFYQISLKAVSLGYTEKELQFMARRWKAPVLDDPEATLTTRVDTQVFERMRRKPADDENTVEAPSLDSFVDQLPNLDFQVDK